MSSEQGGAGWSMLKGGLLVLGGLAALGMVLSIVKPALFIAALGGLGYLGYKVFAGKSKAIASAETKALSSGSSADANFSARMAELERLEKQLDREIKG